MKYISAFLLLTLGLISITAGSPANIEEHAVVLRQGRELDVLGNTRKLIEELIQNLQQSAQQTADAINTFTAGLQNQARLYAEKLASDIQKLRDRVTETITKVTDRFSGAGAAVRKCVESRKQEADTLFSETAAKSKSCADQRIKDVREMVQNLKVLSSDAIQFSNNAMEEMRKCTDENNGNILGAGTCLASLAVQTEMRGAIFLSQSGLSITRINLAIATLPAALEVCAGSQLLNAGVGTARIVMEIGACSASSFFTSFTANPLESKVV